MFLDKQGVVTFLHNIRVPAVSTPSVIMSNLLNELTVVSSKQQMCNCY